MSKSPKINLLEETDIKKILELIRRNYRLFIICLMITICIAIFFNHYLIPVYKVSSSILIKEDTKQPVGQGLNSNFINNGLFGVNTNLQNELFILNSPPVVEQTLKNLELSVNYYYKKGFQYLDGYRKVPFHIMYLQDHVQPVNVKFYITSIQGEYITIKAKSKLAFIYDYTTGEIINQKRNWIFKKTVKFGTLIETPDLAFIIESKETKNFADKNPSSFGFEFTDIPSIRDGLMNNLQVSIVDKLATVIKISLRSKSIIKGIDFENELMNVYSMQNLDRKNHLATITIDYIDKQLNEISDSLSQTEDNLQSFRSSHQLLSITDQSTGLTSQYMNLQNQLAELVSRKRYYDYLSDYLSKNDSFSNIMLPAAIGIQDQLLNNLISELISAQAQRSNLIENNQERNPLVQKLSIQIENIKKTITENISSVSTATSISIDDMNNRIGKIRREISGLPETQRQLGGIERKYRLNDAIYNYLLEKRAEAKITKASNLPDNIIIAPAKMEGLKPISPNKTLNYLTAFLLGFIIPFGYLVIMSSLNNKVESQDDILKITKVPILGKILHNIHNRRNVMFEFPKSPIAESFRALRTNLDFYVRGGHKKVIMVTSCLENEGKTFVAMNLAMSYAQLGRRTILVDFDLRKPETYFKDKEDSGEGLSTYMINKISLEDIIFKSPHNKLDYILSGIIPPNPVELIALERTEKLITRLKDDYDIIVLDTTPLAQVTDAYLLIDYADIKIIVARYNYTIKTVLSYIMNDLQQKTIANTCIVLNDNRFKRDQYGYGYGYNSKEKAINKLKKRFEKYFSLVTRKRL